MGKITVVGLGPGGDNYLTMEAYKVLKNTDINYIRTIKHPIVDSLQKEGVKFKSFDYVYDKHESFDDVYMEIAEEVIKLSESGPVVYCVPGNPFVAERTVELLSENCPKKGIEIEYIHGASFIDAIITRLKKDPVHGLKIIDGLNIENSRIDTEVDSIIIQVYDDMVASNIKIKLMEHYGDDHEVIVIRGAGIPGIEEIIETPLYELDRIDAMDHLASVYVPKAKDDKNKKQFFYDLVDIMDKLRSIDGCPWDREQTHESLKQYLLEETYEVIDAIDSGDLWSLEEELGDLLLQVVFHACIANENGYFNINDVTTGISNKLISRHPHVFGDIDLDSSDEVLVNWQEIKKEEKGIKSYTDAMERIPKVLPATMRATKVQKKAAEVGFQWDDVNGALEKLHEEIEELKEIIDSKDEEKLTEELGDILFAIINVARYIGVTPEFALTNTTDKFIRRFEFIETQAEEKKERIGQMSLENMDKLWEMAKKQEKMKKK